MKPAASRTDASSNTQQQRQLTSQTVSSPYATSMPYTTPLTTKVEQRQQRDHVVDLRQQPSTAPPLQQSHPRTDGEYTVSLMHVSLCRKLKHGGCTVRKSAPSFCKNIGTQSIGTQSIVCAYSFIGPSFSSGYLERILCIHYVQGPSQPLPCFCLPLGR